MTEPYLTIAQNTTYEQTIKKSRFICSIARVSRSSEKVIMASRAELREFRSLNRLNLQRSTMS